MKGMYYRNRVHAIGLRRRRIRSAYFADLKGMIAHLDAGRAIQELVHRSFELQARTSPDYIPPEAKP